MNPNNSIISHLYQLFLQSTGVTTDSRKIEKGNLFFALKGPNFDGNRYAGKALEAGASYAVVDDFSLPENDRFIRVPDVLEALQMLAGTYRNSLSIPVIGITGSNGKTTTKELVHAVLSQKFKTSTTVGNLNNHIGIPLTLLRIPADAEMAVVEMGANHQQEIAGYCTYANPSFGLITNCGKAHLEGFGGVEGIRKGKGELFDHLAKNNATVFVCRDFDYFHEMVKTRNLQNTIWYGTSGDAEIKGNVLNAEPFLHVEIVSGFEQPFVIETQLVGDYNIYNVLAATTIGKYFGISAHAIKSAIENYQPDNSRSQLIHKDGNDIILDAYNANPNSMQLAIENFAKLPAERKLVLLGDMFELGAQSREEHLKLIELLQKNKIENAVLVGASFFALETKPYLKFQTTSECKTYLQKASIENYTILIKGSRGMKMEVLQEVL